ncbi:MAG: tripartite tricarboxylate transporter substrate binding protein, partial [Burkholderiales bacterium]|nr:tripartite tricarboxylate transporter substrate binding protein [Burkholderiales bacterium]
MLGRLIAQQLGPALGRNVIVENKPGAGTAIGASQVARAAPDGNTLLVATSTTLAINPWLYKKLSYDPVRDFAPVTLIGSVPLMVVVHPSVQAKSMAEL